MRVTVSGEIDADTGERLLEAVTRVEAATPSVLVLDLTDVSFFDSTGLEVVLDADLRRRADGRRLVIVLARDGEPWRVLTLAEVLEQLEVEVA